MFQVMINVVTSLEMILKRLKPQSSLEEDQVHGVVGVPGRWSKVTNTLAAVNFPESVELSAIRR